MCNWPFKIKFEMTITKNPINYMGRSIFTKYGLRYNATMRNFEWILKSALRKSSSLGRVNSIMYIIQGME